MSSSDHKSESLQSSGDKDEIFTSSYVDKDLSLTFPRISLFSDTTNVEENTDEALLITSHVPKYNFWTSEQMLENYFGIFLFTLTLIFSLNKVDLTFDDIWLNSTSVDFSQQIVVYPTLICITLIMICIQHKVLNKRRFIRFYSMIFPLIILSDVVGNYYHLEKYGLGPTIFCVIFGLFYRICFDLTNKCHLIDIARLQNLCFTSENFSKISIIILSVNFSTIGTYPAISLAGSWLTPWVTMLFIIIFGRRLLNVDTSIIYAVGIATTGPSASYLIGNLLGYNINLLRRITSIMMIIIILNINCIPLLSESFNLNNKTEGLWISNSVDSIGGAMASGSLGGIVILQYTTISKILNVLLLGPMYLLISKVKSKETNIGVLWEYFPKFIFGFLITSTVITFLPNDMQSITINNCYSMSQWFLKMGLVLIGFDIDIKIFKLLPEYWKLFVLFLIGKFIDVLLGILTAYLSYQI